MNKNLHQRLQNLSITQRQALSDKLDALDVQVTRQQDLKLVAYVTRSPNSSLSAPALRRQLRQHLPAHLQPTDIVWVEALPLLPNKKIDRAALRKVQHATEPPAAAASAIEEPGDDQTSTERSLTEIWSLVLARDDIGRDDNFFDLGGHSVLATLAVSRISQALDIDLPLRAIFEHPTVGELSTFIDTLEASDEDEDEPQLIALPRHTSRADPTPP